ncbi:bestrophin family protein [Psychroserpens sp. SPM9]|uniref:bestrophin family protein n=1 Tax=Psychroserpens sp. SPM9 TaxID=2975598 RepID=UPI0021A5CB0A|nr:bestrophin family ion channel [Psychroserpens sp. SPM9]MDG5491989.1 bestrophin family ion channel [Psychroserpens sp. SPM9]
MYTKKVFKIKDMAKWTRYETLLFVAIIVIFVSLYYFFDLEWLKIPWTPLALIGTAVAFVIGFQNNSAYGRIWEARKIWGGIVNTSRTFGMYVQDMVSNEYAKEKCSEETLQQEIKTLTYRHIAWMTALRHAMRVSKPWETVIHEKTNKEWSKMVRPPEWESNVEDDMRPYLSKQDLDYVMSKNNKQTAVLYLQSHHLKQLKEKGIVWEFSFLQTEGVLEELFTLQGKSERIKNFPYPRQFATLNHYFMWLFVLLLPLAIVPQFAEIGKEMTTLHPTVGSFFIWLSVPFYIIVAWIFHTMERIGRTGENPFEGSANDVPISSMARGIEIDLRQNFGESLDDIPKQFPVIYDTQM